MEREESGMKLINKCFVEMEACTKKEQVEDTKVVRILLGKNHRLVQSVQPAASAKQAGGVNGRKRDEAAGKNEYYEGFDEVKKQIKRKNGC